MKSKETFQDQA